MNICFQEKKINGINYFLYIKINLKKRNHNKYNISSKMIPMKKIIIMKYNKLLKQNANKSIKTKYKIKMKLKKQIKKIRKITLTITK